jgi:methionyl-tRNA formyltransferase
MRFAWVGFHQEGIDALDALLEAGAPIACVLTLRPDLAAKRSGGADYFPVCGKHGVPLHYISDINNDDARSILAAVQPDIVFVIGWHQIVRPDALRLARVGMIGAHASLLPHNRGSAPINWAIINGEKETGNSLIWLAPDVDAGDIIDQMAFPISETDTCATLYRQVARTNREMLVRVLPKLLRGERPGSPQIITDEPVLRRRRPADGLIDWTQSADRIYDFVRGLTRPYPGAFSTLDGRKWTIWRAARTPAVPDGSRPGEIVGSVTATDQNAAGIVVACGQGGIIVLEMESEDGNVVQGRALAALDVTGRQFTPPVPAGAGA